jgi:hypothetical protein
MPAARDRGTPDRLKTALVVAVTLLAVALAILSLYHSLGPKSQWGSQAPEMKGGGPMAPTPAPLPPGRR